MTKRVVVAMSGGVDSSVAAALLKEQGHDVIGVTLQLLPRDLDGEVERFGGCCGVGTIRDAQRVARHLAIPHYVLNFRSLFEQTVIADFVREYRRGRTPNPCIRCNQYIKFEALLEKARQLGAGWLATGHYARIQRNGRWLLLRHPDRSKDQSYFLYTMTQAQLAATLFPLGQLGKTQVREIARRLGLPVADKPDSQDICFTTAGGHARFVAERAPETTRPGPILSRDGGVLGTHRGIAAYTIGQRHGLGIASPSPLYVLAIDPEANTITVGRRDEASFRRFRASRLNWIARDKLDEPLRCDARIRYRQREVPAEVTPQEGNGVIVTLEEPQPAVAPGQAVVFYDGDIVLGGGTIEGAE